MHARALDVADEASPRALAADLGWALGRVDVLINNAGHAADWSETAATADLREAHAVMEANLFGAWRTTQALLPLLRRSRRGRIVNVSSGAGSHVDPRFGLAAGAPLASYAVSKAALNALTVKLALELREDGILVNAVCPGLTATTRGAGGGGCAAGGGGCGERGVGGDAAERRADGGILSGRAGARVVSNPGVAVRTSADSVIPASDSR